MSPAFRLALTYDVEPLLELIEQFYHEEQIPFNRDLSRAAVQELIAHPELGRIWLIEDEARCAGYLVAILGFILEFGGRQVFLDELYIAPEFQGRGLGTAALHFLEEESRIMDARVLRLEVTRTNSRALALYQRRGFELHDRQTMSKRL